MPVPPEYERASEKFYAYLVEARNISGLVTTHQTYTMTQGVFQTFRRRLSLEEAIAFANVLPLLLRALFVTDWNTQEPRQPFEDRASMTEEVKSLRADHNFSPDDAILSVAKALRKFVDECRFDALLAKLPEGAVQFWSTAP